MESGPTTVAAVARFNSSYESRCHAEHHENECCADAGPPVAAQLTAGTWQPVLDDESLAGPRNGIRSLLLCSGRIYIDLVTSGLRGQNAEDAIARLEQLYPFPEDELRELIASYPSLERVIWVQEEPLNMGAWNYLRPRLRQLCGDALSSRVSRSAPPGRGRNGSSRSKGGTCSRRITGSSR